MNSSRKQRRFFVNNAKKQWERGEISKDEFLELKKDVKNLGLEKLFEMQQILLEQKGMEITHNENINIDSELDDDFAPEDL